MDTWIERHRDRVEQRYRRLDGARWVTTGVGEGYAKVDRMLIDGAV